MINRFVIILALFIGFNLQVYAQIPDSLKTKSDTIKIINHGKADSSFNTIQQVDSVLRIRNLNPYITLSTDSLLNYELLINKDVSKYYWFLKNSPPGVQINKNTGVLHLKAEKALFLNGRLKYDQEYKINLGVQNLDNPADRIDTSITVMFYNTEIIPSKIKPAVNSILYVDEGDSISFKVQCEDGNFPIDKIIMTSNYPIKPLTPITKCGDDFKWSPPFGFVKSGDKDKQRVVIVNFIGSNKFNARDTAVVQIFVKENINYPQKVLEYEEVKKNIRSYSNQLKATFMTLDKKVRSTKGTRNSFDLTSAASSLGGTVFSSLPTDGQKTAGKILPSVGVAMVPVKESVAPNKTAEQNSATLVRNSIKRLEYLLQNNALVGDKDPEILTKTQKLRDELKAMQVALIEVPLVEVGDSPEELDKYFNNKKVNKKYRMKKS
ncbi:MAG: hypothetical protein IT249_03850 [Chitinophagaceae bacterium]|nr:hypothetical protein [Chitinophagaceae bacterium]